MPQAFAERVLALRVDRLGSRWIHWGAMSNSPPIGSLSRDRLVAAIASGLIGGWPRVLAGWTLFGLCSFAACLLADAGVSGNSRWPDLLAYSLGGAWIWAALTPAVLRVTGGVSFSAGQRA